MITMDEKVREIIEQLSELPEVCAIAAGGSRASGNADELSDYDLYVYTTENISPDIKRGLFEPYCSRMEIDNDYWEKEDNLILSSGMKVDIIYRTIEKIQSFVSFMLSGKRSFNGYTTCFLHNLKTAEICYDRTGTLTEIQQQCQQPLPEELKNTIITRNMHLVSEGIDCFPVQIAKAVKRNDTVSINHRITGFLASYFDVIFALNDQTHPGEKRLVSLCQKYCSLLPQHFEENINTLFADMYGNTQKVNEDIKLIIKELKVLLSENGYHFPEE